MGSRQGVAEDDGGGGEGHVLRKTEEVRESLREDD